MSIVVVVPVLGRPQNAAPLAANLADVTELDYRLVFVCSPDDTEQQRACEDTYGDTLMMLADPGPGDFARKVNAAYRLTEEPWIFQAADDVRFEPGWDTALMSRARTTGALVIGTQDSGNPMVKAGRHSTHTLVARSYADDPGASMDGPGTVFSEAYGHQWTDTELVQLAMARGVWAFCDDARVTHLHPFWVGKPARGKMPLDATYTRGMSTSTEDSRLFQQRSKMWRGLRTSARVVESPHHAK